MKKRQISIHKPREGYSLPIVSDAAVASEGVGDGRLIPLLILDTTGHRDVDAFVDAHQFLSPGDVTVYWGKTSRFIRDTVTLALEFNRPAEITALIDFHIARQGNLVDSILSANGFYFQPGRPGDRLSTTMDKPRIMIEIPDTQFGSYWEPMFFKAVAEGFRNKGLSRHEAKTAAENAIQEWRKFTKIRMRAQ